MTNLGQIFTPANVAEQMLSLRKNYGRTLEPSCGKGIFLNQIPGAMGIELDGNICPTGALNMDFFDYPTTEKFDCIIGNPPYVSYQEILPSTKECLGKYYINGSANLYLSFILKCMDHLNDGGEIIFIVPRNFIKATSAMSVNRRFYEDGSFTHFVESGDKMVFKDASVNAVIWRWVKGRTDRKMEDGRTVYYNNGMLSFFAEGVPFSDYFKVKVGAISGSDKLFTSPEGIDFVCSTTCSQGDTRRMIYNQPHPALEPIKYELMERSGKNSNDTWWKWVRKCPENNMNRVYVQTKTRNDYPFFAHDCRMYDGSVLGIFYEHPWPEYKVAETLNHVDWDAQGFMCGDRYLFSQRSLENSLIPFPIAEEIQKLNYVINRPVPNYCSDTTQK